MRKVVCAVVVLALCCGIALSEEIRAIIIKVDGNKVTFAENKGKGERGPEKTMTVADNAKILKGKFNPDTKKLEAGDAIQGGLKNELFSKIGEKGVGATIDYTGDKINKIIVGGGRGGRKGGQ
jgi:hypothetical protein